MNATSRRNWIRYSAASIVPGFIAPAALSGAAAKEEVKITRAEAFHVRVPYAEHLREDLLKCYRTENRQAQHLLRWIVKLHTGAGLVGVGESVRDPGPGLAALVGRSLWEPLNDLSIGPAALMAVYDLAAQAEGLPVSRLFSANPLPTIRQIWWSHCFPPKLMQSEAKRGLEAGYTVLKVKARPYEDLVEQVAAIVDVVPHDYQIFADANGTFFTPEKTLDMAQALERYFQVKGFEEPIPSTDIVGYRRIRPSLPLRLSVHWEAVDDRAFLVESLCDAFVVEDFLWGPPLIEKSVICNLFGPKLCVENGLYSGISQVFQAHMAAALPNIEFNISLTHMIEDDLVLESFLVERGGLYKVPTKPGLGVTLDDKAVQKYRIA